MAFVSTSVPEPASTDLAVMYTSQDALTWAKIVGDIDLGYSRAGAVLLIMAPDGSSTIPHIASISPTEFEAGLANWHFDKEGDGENGDDLTRAKPVDKGRARSFRKACRLWAGLDWSAIGIAE